MLVVICVPVQSYSSVFLSRVPQSEVAVEYRNHARVSKLKNKLRRRRPFLSAWSKKKTKRNTMNSCRPGEEKKDEKRTRQVPLGPVKVRQKGNKPKRKKGGKKKGEKQTWKKRKKDRDSNPDFVISAFSHTAKKGPVPGGPPIQIASIFSPDLRVGRRFLRFS